MAYVVIRYDGVNRVGDVAENPRAIDFKSLDQSKANLLAQREQLNAEYERQAAAVAQLAERLNEVNAELAETNALIELEQAEIAKADAAAQA
jgi:peptidoglycan hydrolase CwlO-like protein